MRLKRLCLLMVTLSFGSFLFTASPALAQKKQDEAAKTEKIDKTQAAERARAQVNGRVLKVEKRQDKYRVKVLQKSGRVVSVDVDNQSGSVKRSKDKKDKR
ncbi:PepSY domain-containing protein [Alteromonas flava]|uniref:PepSY domain-containing protein n=1 Tax=Alteromonas flava TaxID=2048003 RepID=UPI000C29204D|nr:PepSY domain-containing protein [Alteromonas flava]